jgi:pimeloyl-ACP methyl ester carboxylesterase
MSTTRGELDLSVEGGRIAGRYAAPDSPTGAPIVVAIHGAGHTAAYFDTEAVSLPDTGAELGLTTVILDRPGYGQSWPPPGGDFGFEAIAKTMATAIAEVVAQLDQSAPGVVLTGHSSGGAIATRLASLDALPFELLGLSIVGVGPVLGPFGHNIEADLPQEGFMDPPPAELVRNFLFGPPWTYAEDAVLALGAVGAGVPVSEPRQVNRFPDWLPEAAARIDVPVQCVMPMLDVVWPYSAENLRRLTEAFTASPYVEGLALRAAGHAADHHLTGRGLHLRQIAFALECAVREPAVA